MAKVGKREELSWEQENESHKVESWASSARDPHTSGLSDLPPAI